MSQEPTHFPKMIVAEPKPMTTFRPDTTFPYLKIAREYDVPYGEVIRFVQQIDDDRLMNRWGNLVRWQKAVCCAWDNLRLETARAKRVVEIG